MIHYFIFGSGMAASFILVLLVVWFKKIPKRFDDKYYQIQVEQRNILHDRLREERRFCDAIERLSEKVSLTESPNKIALKVYDEWSVSKASGLTGNYRDWLNWKIECEK